MQWSSNLFDQGFVPYLLIQSPVEETIDKGVGLGKDLIYQLTRGWGHEVGCSLSSRDHAKNLKHAAEVQGLGAVVRGS